MAVNAGVPIDNLPKEMVMSTEDMVDAALAGLDKGEFATAPSLADIAKWDSFEAARRALAQELSRSVPAKRYGLASTAA